MMAAALSTYVAGVQQIVIIEGREGQEGQEGQEGREGRRSWNARSAADICPLRFSFA